MSAVTTDAGWTEVCELGDIVPNTGVCALLGDRHIAIFRVGEHDLYAIDNIDPRAGASVLARGLVGNLGAQLVVASPMYKQHYDLRTGECLELPQYSVRAWQVRLDGSRVLLGKPIA